MEQSRKFLFVFDFDQTIVDLNTDTYIVRSLPENKLPQNVLDMAPKGWNIFMQEVLKHINQQGVSINQMQDCLRTMELTKGYDQILSLIKQKKPIIDAVIVSDSNQFFIDTLLEHWRVKELFHKVFTNPCEQNAENQLVSMIPFHQHTCETPTCPKNLCKKSVLLGHWTKNNEMQDLYERIYYFGDGKNDYCPLQLLRKQDVVFARKGYMLDQLIQEKPVPCQVFSWDDGHQIMDSQHFKDINNI